MTAQSRRTRATLGLLLSAALFALPSAHAQPNLAQETSGGIPAELAAKLSEEQLRTYVDWRRVSSAFDRQLEAYWKVVNDRRDERKRKFATNQAYTLDDYVREQPPKYAGPALAPAVAKVIADIETARQAAGGAPPKSEPEKATVADFLSAARELYGFVPSSSREIDFKRRYASEALAAGLTKAQVTRVYALETGGIGTYDMQAGINPLTRTGKPISSALGYAQLLHSNSVNELVKHGDGFARRLAQMAADPTTAKSRAQQLRAKSTIVLRMLRAARSVPNEWSQHVKLGATAQGHAMHALNLDADIGPWLQVLKLKGLLDTAAREAKRTSLSGAELELMNLAGPRTGLEMMQAIGRGMPTSNFFSQQGYYRNTIVRQRTGAELLAALDERMEQNLKKPGSIEFAAAFDAVMAARVAPAAKTSPGPQSLGAAPIR